MPVRPISVSVPATLAATWKEQAKHQGLTQADLVLDAVAAHRDTLPDLVREYRTDQRRAQAASSDGVFVRTGERPPATDPFVAVSLRMLSANVDVLDGLVHASGAESRSQLVAAALQVWLRERGVAS